MINLNRFLSVAATIVMLALLSSGPGVIGMLAAAFLPMVAIFGVAWMSAEVLATDLRNPRLVNGLASSFLSWSAGLLTGMARWMLSGPRAGHVLRDSEDAARSGSEHFAGRSDHEPRAERGGMYYAYRSTGLRRKRTVHVYHHMPPMNMTHQGEVFIGPVASTGASRNAVIIRS